VIPPMVPRIPEIDLIKGTFKGFYQKMASKLERIMKRVQIQWNTIIRLSLSALASTHSHPQDLHMHYPLALVPYRNSHK